MLSTLSEEWIQVTTTRTAHSVDLLIGLRDSLFFLQESTIAPQVKWPLYEIADFPRAQPVSLEPCSTRAFLTMLRFGAFISVSWHSLFLRYFSWCVRTFLSVIQKKEDWITNRSPVSSCLSLTIQLFLIILKQVLSTSYMQSSLTLPLVYLIELSLLNRTLSWCTHYEVEADTQRVNQDQ